MKRSDAVFRGGVGFATEGDQVGEGGNIHQIGGPVDGSEPTLALVIDVCTASSGYWAVSREDTVAPRIPGILPEHSERQCREECTSHCPGCSGLPHGAPVHGCSCECDLHSGSVGHE